MKTAVALLVAVIVVACATALPSPSAASMVSVGVSNDTTMALAVSINDQRLGDVSPADTAAEFTPTGSLRFPWSIEVRSTSGTVLLSMIVQGQDVVSTTAPGGEWIQTQRFERVDTTCGRLMVWAGEVEPSVADLPAPTSSVAPCHP